MPKQRELHDHFFREAKRNGYRSRAAYKLIEIDDKRNIFQKGDVVLDLGAAPGSWLQVTSERVGQGGMVIGIDLNPIEGLLPENVKTIQDDVTSVTPTAIRSVVGFDRDIVFDVIISDMAPNTTGSRTVDHHQSVRLCHTAIDLTATMLLPKGNLVMKVLEGEAYRDLLDRAAQCFDIAKGFKPKASRSISTEIFIVCTGRKSEMPESTPCAPPTPTTGW